MKRISLVDHTEEKVIGDKYIVLLTYDVETWSYDGRINVTGGEIAVFKKGVEKGFICRHQYNSKTEVVKAYKNLDTIQDVEQWIQRRNE